MSESYEENTKAKKIYVKHLVLDTGAVIANVNLHEIAENYYAPHEILSELRSLRAKICFDTLPFEIKIREPSISAIKRVIEVSKRTGDYISLSLADIKVIALTYDVYNEYCGDFRRDRGFESASNSSSTLMSDDKQFVVASVESLSNSGVSDGIHVNDTSDEEGWITENNLSHILKKMGGLEVEEGVSVGCLTTDFAVQNVLFKMNLSLVSLNGYRIKQLRSSVLRCRGCFTTTSIMTKQFCPACGNKLLHKCAVSVDENGDQVLHINWQRLANKRGLKHSIPAPKGGKHAVNEKLFEDQPMPQNRMATIRSDPFGENPFPMHDVTSRSAMLGLQTLNSRQKRRWNPNESKSRKHK